VKSHAGLRQNGVRDARYGLMREWYTEAVMMMLIVVATCVGRRRGTTAHATAEHVEIMLMIQTCTSKSRPKDARLRESKVCMVEMA